MDTVIFTYACSMHVVPVTMWTCVISVYEAMNVNANLCSMRGHKINVKGTENCSANKESLFMIDYCSNE